MRLNPPGTARTNSPVTEQAGQTDCAVVVRMSEVNSSSLPDLRSRGYPVEDARTHGHIRSPRCCRGRSVLRQLRNIERLCPVEQLAPKLFSQPQCSTADQKREQ